MPFSLLLTTLHHLLVVALKRKNLATFQILILHNVLKIKGSRDYLLVSCNPIGFPLARCRRGSAAPTQPLITSLARLPRVRWLVEEGPTTHTRLARVKTKNASLSKLKMLGAVVPSALVRLVSRSCDP